MFIWTQIGEKLIKTEDIKIISMEEGIKQAREPHSVTQGVVYILRAYYSVDDKRNSVILATYNDAETTREQFVQMIRAIGEGAVVFSFCEDILLADDGKVEPEEVIDLEP